MKQQLASRNYRIGRDRGCAYLLKQQRPEGRFGPPERGLADYYKVPLAYLVCGASAEANRLFEWIRKHGISLTAILAHVYRKQSIITMSTTIPGSLSELNVKAILIWLRGGWISFHDFGIQKVEVSIQAQPNEVRQHCKTSGLQAVEVKQRCTRGGWTLQLALVTG